VPYDVERDLTLVSNCVRVFNLLAVNNDLPVRTVRELVEYAKKNPGKLTMSSGGNGTTGHLGGELFKAMTGVDIVHVPYKGSPQAIHSSSSPGARRRSGRR
jgi:tripartite-type tricarboxylate transporter receptor subunit TctC